MVRFTLKRSLRAESCWSLLVVKGAVALRRRSFFSTELTVQVACFSASSMRRAVASSGATFLSGFAPTRCASKAGGLPEKRCVKRPVFLLLEGLDLAVALNDE